jgi:hypothetical protein
VELVFYEATSTFTFVATRSKGNVTITSCHPSYMALAFCHGGTYTRKCVRPFAGHAKEKDLTL